MSSKLVFHGGLFVVLPGAKDRNKVDVLMRTPEPVGVIDQQAQNNLPGWESKLSSASRLDFLSEQGKLNVKQLSLRRVSHAMPVNYNDFHKNVGFNAGFIRDEFQGNIPANATAIFADAQAADEPDELLKHYKRLFPDVPANHDESLKKGIVQSFGSSPSVQMWLLGYRIEVDLPKDFEVLVNGRVESSWPKQDLDIVFSVHPGSVVPHYPLDNPHVLEQPPTI